MVATDAVFHGMKRRDVRESVVMHRDCIEQGVPCGVDDCALRGGKTGALDAAVAEELLAAYEALSGSLSEEYPLPQKYRMYGKVQAALGGDS